MDLTTPYEVNSDQDVASLFIIPSSIEATTTQNDTAALDETSETGVDGSDDGRETLSWVDSQKAAESRNGYVTNQEKQANLDTRAIKVNKKTDLSGEIATDDGNPHNEDTHESQETTSRSQKNTLQCPICMQNFPLNTDLGEHKCHPAKNGEDILCCSLCQTTFDEMEKLKEHMRKHWESLPFKCHVCSERYWTEKSLKRHLVKHEMRDKPFACVECNSKYVHKRQLLLHIANVHSRDKTARKFPCDLCGRNFLRKCDLSKHAKKCGGLESDSAVLENDAGKANSPFPERDAKMSERRLVSASPDESAESRSPTTKVNSDPSLGIGEQNEESQTASDVIKVEPKLTEDESTSSNSQNNSSLLVPGSALPNANLMSLLCSIQGSGIPAPLPFFTNTGLEQSTFTAPLFSMLPIFPISTLLGQTSASTEDSTDMDKLKEDDTKVTDTDLQCGTLNDSVLSRRKSKPAKRTISTLLDNLPPQSDLGEKLVNVVEIIRRSKRFATADNRVPDAKGGALYNCQICTKPFPTLSELQSHCASHGSNVFSCKYCKKVLSSQVSLYRHEADHEDNRPFQCDLCNKAFVLKAELNRHTEVQHSKRPFTCKVCRFNFSCQANLDAHMPVHLEKKTCPMCPRSFTTETYLQRHIARYHVSTAEFDDSI